MFSTIVPQYADVFAKSEPDMTSLWVTVGLVGLGFTLIAISIFLDGDSTLGGIGFTILVVTMIGVFISSQISYTNHQQEIVRNMVDNVREKYHAELQVSKSQTTNLDKFQTYTLTFDNGAEGKYRMKFAQTGEPVIASDAAAPSADELNADTVKTPPTSSSKTSPTPAELETSAKK